MKDLVVQDKDRGIAKELLSWMEQIWTGSFVWFLIPKKNNKKWNQNCKHLPSHFAIFFLGSSSLLTIPSPCIWAVQKEREWGQSLICNTSSLLLFFLLTLFSLTQHSSFPQAAVFQIKPATARLLLGQQSEYVQVWLLMHSRGTAASPWSSPWAAAATPPFSSLGVCTVDPP